MKKKVLFTNMITKVIRKRVAVVAVAVQSKVYL